MTELTASMAENTWYTYKTAVESFNHFRYTFSLQPTSPAPLDHIVHFIADISTKNQAPVSMMTYISGLSYIHKMQRLENVTKSFIVTKLFEGAKKILKHFI